MIKPRLIVLFMVAGIAVSSCSRPESPVTKPPASVSGVRIGVVRATAIDVVFEVPGVVRSSTSAILAPRTMGNVVAVHVREGQAVHAGQVLVEIDDRDAEVFLKKANAGSSEVESAAEEIDRSIRASAAARAGAAAQEHLASATLARYRALFERRSVSQQEFDEAEARFKSAAADVERADQQLLSLEARKKQIQSRSEQAAADIDSARVQSAYTRLVSPLDGVVTSKPAEVGMLAAPGIPLVTVESARYELQMSVEENRIGMLHTGDPVEVRIDAAGGDALVSRVVEVTPVADPMSRSFTAKASLPADGRLRSGLFGRGTFKGGVRQALLVPRSAMVQRGQLTSVFVVDGSGIARTRLIRTGREMGDSVEVLSGLEDGERIVTEGVEKLADGVAVQS